MGHSVHDLERPWNLELVAQLPSEEALVPLPWLIQVGNSMHEDG
jgi:hypothetical protein